MNDTSTLLDRHRAPLAKALSEGHTEAVQDQLNELHPAEIADLLETFPPDERVALWRWVAPASKGEVLIEARREVRNQLIAETAADELVSALTRVDIDALADIDHVLPATVVDAVLQAMDAQRRQRFEAVRSYADDSAGGLMDADAVAVRADVTLEVVLRYLRALRQSRGALPAHTDALMVVSNDNRYLGVLQLSDLMSLDLGLRVAAVMDRGTKAIPVTMPAAKVARLFQDRDLVSVAVVDGDGRLLGRITVDDVLDVIRTHEEDAALSPAGLDTGVDLFATVWTSARRRTAWLGIHLAGAFSGAWVIGQFEASIAQMVALAVLMPVIAAAGGVAGNQTQALVTRGLALEQIARSNVLRLLRKELGVSLANGTLWALIVGALLGVWFENFGLAVVFGVALVFNLLSAALAGTIVPILLSRSGFDPALGSTVMVTAFADIMGFLCFLGLATLWLL
jgi:magnesium transporter